jgi:Holliday junction resolvase-like predicted endonuclease
MEGDRRAALGRAGEAAAEAYLVRGGMRLVERDVRLRNGQIDLVMLDGLCLVLVEVKASRGGDFGLPQEGVPPPASRPSSANWPRHAGCFIQGLGMELPFDVVAVAMDRTGASRGFVHIPGVALN